MAWLASRSDGEIVASIVSVGEMLRGAYLLATRDPARMSRILAWIADVETANEILDVDRRVIEAWARLRVAYPGQALTEDALIAATAMAHGLVSFARVTAATSHRLACRCMIRGPDPHDGSPRHHAASTPGDPLVPILLVLPLIVILVFSLGDRAPEGGYAPALTLAQYANLPARWTAFQNTLMLAPLGTLVTCSSPTRLPTSWRCAAIRAGGCSCWCSSSCRSGPAF